MNYRHAYHAGNVGDVLKHAVLALALEHLKGKDKAFFVLDTHAGAGRYDLAAPEAAKTGEAERGILKLLAAPDPPAALAPYLGVVRDLNPEGAVRWYPGSPRLVRALLRRGDRLAAAEMHPATLASLRAEFAGDRQVTVSGEDGYRLVKALLPPAERRGLVILDPPFESPDEFARLETALAVAHARFPQGTLIAWYPIKGREAPHAFVEAVRAAGLAATLCVELLIAPASEPERLSGCGLIVVNPPWTLAAALGEICPALARILGDGMGGYRVEWLAGER